MTDAMSAGAHPVQAALIAVATIDNHDAIREGLAGFIQREAPDLTMVASCGGIDEYLALEVTADVVLLDLLLAAGESLGRIGQVVASGAVVLMYTSEERPVPLREAVKAGASGVLLKSDPMATVTAAVRAAANGEFCVSGPVAHALLTDASLVPNLSERQVEILEVLSDGEDYRGAAGVLGMAEGTLKTQLARIREKYSAIGVAPRNTHHLTRLAARNGYLRSRDSTA